MSRRAYGVRVRTGLAGLRHASGTLAEGRVGRARDGQPEYARDRAAVRHLPAIVIARALAERLKIHYTPKYGNRLNIEETKLSALRGQSLNQRMPTSAR